jgi:hypothetical protein
MWGSGTVERLRQGLALGLAVWLAGCSCADRAVEEEEPPPDIDGLCRVYCSRVMECLWTPEIGATFSTEAECFRNCQDDVVWGLCPAINEALFECLTRYECPEFAEFGHDCPEGQCCAELDAVSVCVAGASK